MNTTLSIAPAVAPAAYQDRARVSLFEALRVLSSPSNTIRHWIVNGDGTYSIMSHINCEWCVYCEASQNAETLALGSGLISAAEPFEALPDPYAWFVKMEEQIASDEPRPESIHVSGECPCAKCAAQRRQGFALANAWQDAVLIVCDILSNVACGHTDDISRGMYEEWIAYAIATAAEVSGVLRSQQSNYEQALADLAQQIVPLREVDRTMSRVVEAVGPYMRPDESVVNTIRRVFLVVPDDQKR